MTEIKSEYYTLEQVARQLDCKKIDLLDNCRQKKLAIVINWQLARREECNTLCVKETHWLPLTIIADIFPPELPPSPCERCTHRTDSSKCHFALSEELYELKERLELEHNYVHIRHNHLYIHIDKINNLKHTQVSDATNNKPMGGKQESTHLKIIGALVKIHYQQETYKKPTGHNSSLIADSIVKELSKLNYDTSSFKSDTVRKYISLAVKKIDESKE